MPGDPEPTKLPTLVDEGWLYTSRHAVDIPFSLTYIKGDDGNVHHFKDVNAVSFGIGLMHYTREAHTPAGVLLC